MKDVKWIKIATDIFDNPKIKYIREQKDGDITVLVWIMLLITAGKCNANGKIFLTENVAFSEKNLAKNFKISLQKFKNSKKIFTELEMIYEENGFIFIANWEKYQSVSRLDEIREYNRTAQRRSRAKKRSDQSKNVNDKSLTSQACQDTEEEGEEEIDIHSFNLYKCARENFDKKDEIRREFLGGKLGGGVVMLSPQQFDDLLDKLSFDEFEKYIGIVRDCELKGQNFKKKTHYRAILDMVKADRAVRKE